MNRITAVDPLEAVRVGLVGLAVALVALGVSAMGASLGLVDLLGGTADGRVLGTLVFGLFTATILVLMSGARPFGRSPQR